MEQSIRGLCGDFAASGHLPLVFEFFEPFSKLNELSLQASAVVVVVIRRERCMISPKSIDGWFRCSSERRRRRGIGRLVIIGRYPLRDNWASTAASESSRSTCREKSGSDDGAVAFVLL